MKQFSFILIIIAIILNSCKTDNGKYIIYKTVTDDSDINYIHPIQIGRNASLEKYLDEMFSGLKYKIIFKDDYAQLETENQKSNLVLSKEVSKSKDKTIYYSANRTSGKAKLHFTLIKVEGDKLKLAIDCYYPSNTSLYIPAQLGDILDKNSFECGRVVCYLSKVD